jgi:hypothetical protein
MSQLPAPSLIAELEVRQDEALQSLAELEQRLEAALAEFGGVSPRSSQGVKVGRKQASELAAVELKIHRPEESQQNVTAPAA